MLTINDTLEKVEIKILFELGNLISVFQSDEIDIGTFLDRIDGLTSKYNNSTTNLLKMIVSMNKGNVMEDNEDSSPSSILPPYHKLIVVLELYEQQLFFQEFSQFYERLEKDEEQFICPLGFQLMKNPIVLPCGHCFEKNIFLKEKKISSSFFRNQGNNQEIEYETYSPTMNKQPSPSKKSGGGKYQRGGNSDGKRRKRGMYAREKKKTIACPVCNVRASVDEISFDDSGIVERIHNYQSAYIRGTEFFVSLLMNRIFNLSKLKESRRFRNQQKRTGVDIIDDKFENLKRLNLQQYQKIEEVFEKSILFSKDSQETTTREEQGEEETYFNFLILFHRYFSFKDVLFTEQKKNKETLVEEENKRKRLKKLLMKYYYKSKQFDQLIEFLFQNNRQNYELLIKGSSTASTSSTTSLMLNEQNDKENEQNEEKRMKLQKMKMLFKSFFHLSEQAKQKEEKQKERIYENSFLKYFIKYSKLLVRIYSSFDDDEEDDNIAKPTKPKGNKKVQQVEMAQIFFKYFELYCCQKPNFRMFLRKKERAEEEKKTKEKKENDEGEEEEEEENEFFVELFELKQKHFRVFSSSEDEYDFVYMKIVSDLNEEKKKLKEGIKMISNISHKRINKKKLEAKYIKLISKLIFFHQQTFKKFKYLFLDQQKMEIPCLKNIIELYQQQLRFIEKNSSPASTSTTSSSCDLIKFKISKYYFTLSHYFDSHDEKHVDSLKDSLKYYPIGFKLPEKEEKEEEMMENHFKDLMEILIQSYIRKEDYVGIQKEVLKPHEELFIEQRFFFEHYFFQILDHEKQKHDEKMKHVRRINESIKKDYLSLERLQFETMKKLKKVEKLNKEQKRELIQTKNDVSRLHEEIEKMKLMISQPSFSPQQHQQHQQQHQSKRIRRNNEEKQRKKSSSSIDIVFDSTTVKETTTTTTTTTKETKEKEKEEEEEKEEEKEDKTNYFGDEHILEIFDNEEKEKEELLKDFLVSKLIGEEGMLGKPRKVILEETNEGVDMRICFFYFYLQICGSFQQKTLVLYLFSKYLFFYPKIELIQNRNFLNFDSFCGDSSTSLKVYQQTKNWDSNICESFLKDLFSDKEEKEKECEFENQKEFFLINEEIHENYPEFDLFFQSIFAEFMKKEQQQQHQSSSKKRKKSSKSPKKELSLEEISQQKKEFLSKIFLEKEKHNSFVCAHMFNYLFYFQSCTNFFVLGLESLLSVPHPKLTFCIDCFRFCLSFDSFLNQFHLKRKEELHFYFSICVSVYFELGLNHLMNENIISSYDYFKAFSQYIPLLIKSPKFRNYLNVLIYDFFTSLEQLHEEQKGRRNEKNKKRQKQFDLLNEKIIPMFQKLAVVNQIKYRKEHFLNIFPKNSQKKSSQYRKKEKEEVIHEFDKLMNKEWESGQRKRYNFEAKAAKLLSLKRKVNQKYQKMIHKYKNASNLMKNKNFRNMNFSIYDHYF